MSDDAERLNRIYEELNLVIAAAEGAFHEARLGAPVSLQLLEQSWLWWFRRDETGWGLYVCRGDGSRPHLGRTLVNANLQERIAALDLIPRLFEEAVIAHTIHCDEVERRVEALARWVARDDRPLLPGAKGETDEQS